MKIIKKWGLLAILFLATSAFNMEVSAQTKSEILIVADQKASCRGIVAQDCLQVKHLDEEKFSLFRQNIEGFNFIPGYFYVLNVQNVIIRNRKADSLTSKYQLRVILARVKADENTTAPNESGLFGTDWKLTKIDGRVISSEKSFIRFDESKNSIGGNGGCNVFGGSMERNGNQISFSKVFSTKMFCQNAQEVENKFLGSLDRVTKYEIIKGKLHLMANDRILLEFEAKK